MNFFKIGTSEKIDFMDRWFLGLVFFVVLSWVFPTLSSANQKMLRVQVGESRVLKFDYDIQKVATGSPEICQVTRTDVREILVNAKTAGETNILVWDSEKLREEIAIIVSLRDATGLAKDLTALLEDVEGVRIRVIGDRVAVEGEVFSRKDLERTSSVLEGMNGVINLVEMSPLLKKVLAEEMQKAIGLKGVSVTSAKESFLLEGIVFSKADSERAQMVASAYADKVVNVIKVMERGTLGPASMVQMTLTVMEIEKDALKGLGFHWNPGASGGGSGTFSGGSGQSSSFLGAITGTISNLFPKMQKINEQGKGRSLFQQSVVTKSGDSAHFFVGDEIPIPVAQDGGKMSVEYKKVGLTMNFSPVIDQWGNIDTSVDVDSSFVAGEGIGGAPKIRDTKLKTAVYVKHAESIALGGMIGQREAKSFSGSAPGGGAALLQLNKSNKFMHDQSQVLIFVTPEILNTGSEAIKDMGDKVRDSFKDYEYDNINKKPGR
jgi:pilus assembly protein CpaC